MITKSKDFFFYLKFFFLASLLTGLITLIPTSQVKGKIFFLEAEYYQETPELKKITVGKGEIISSDNPISRVAVSGPNIADLQVLSEKQIFVRAKNLGLTTLLAWEKGHTAPSRFDIAVIPDIESLKKQLKELDENIQIEYIPPSSILSASSSQAGGATGAGQTEEGTGAGGEPTSLGALPDTSGASGQGDSGPTTNSGRIILKGEVINAEVIAQALQIAGAYINDQGIRIISQPGGQVVDGLSGEYNISSNSDSGESASGEGSAVSFGVRDSISFTSNRYANLSRGTIATTQNGSVVSLLTVKNPPQIAVAIRFYEIERTLARNLGLNTTLGGHTLQGASFVGGNGLGMLIGGIASISKLNAFMGGAEPEFTFGSFGSGGGSFLGQSLGEGVTGAIFYPKNGIGAVIQALVERGEVKSLAEPTLVIQNGEPASFLAGGEVPIVRSVFTAGGASQDVTYEPFGIKFTILPTITRENKIHLQLIPELREIDTDLSNFVVPPGSTSIRPPAFTTKRSQTQVELEPGQAFAISGLLREDNSRSLRKVPGIGDIPILGSLFRSKSFRNEQSELLVVVAPEIVRPAEPEKMAKKLSIPEVPYDEFKQIPALRPYIDTQDEKGPGLQKPLDAGKYNQKGELSLNSLTKPQETKTTHNVNKIPPDSKDMVQKPVPLKSSNTYQNNQLISFRPTKNNIVTQPFKLETISHNVKPNNMRRNINATTLRKGYSTGPIRTFRNSNKEKVCWLD